ncbi:hypothetical protein [Geoglobus sp.]
MSYRITSLVLSAVAGVIAVQTATSTGLFRILAMLIPQELVYVVVAIPLISFLLGRKVFGTSYLALLILIALTPMLPDSEVFEGVVDSLYYLGFKDLSRTLLDIFHLRDVYLQLFLISSLYIVSSYLERIEEYGKKLRSEGYAFSLHPTMLALVAVLSALYTLPADWADLSLPGDYLYGIAGALLLVVAISVMWWSR